MKFLKNQEKKQLIGNLNKKNKIFPFSKLMRWIICLLFIINSFYLFGQKINLEILSDDSKVELKYKKEISQPKESDKEVQKVFKQLYEKGYLSAIVKDKKTSENKIEIKLELGPVFSFGEIKKGNAEEQLLNKIGFREKIYHKKILSQTLIAELAEKTLRYYEENGYPFATFSLDSGNIEQNKFSASIKIEKNKLYKIDSIIIKGGAKIKKYYIENYISICEGDIYNEKLISLIDQRMKELSFAELIKPTEVVFTKTQCYIYIYIKEKKASQFNGVLGILPDNNTGKITITGDARIRLKNAIRNGELFDLNWRKLNTDIQDMRININYPFLFKSSFGFDGLFKLYKKDTTFLELNQNAGLLYLLNSGNFLKLSFNFQSSVLLTPGMFSNSTSLPEFADVNSVMYGIGTKIEKLDYRLNPTKGFLIETELRVGQKNIKKNSELNENVYENINLKTAKYFLSFQGDLYFSFLKRTTLKIANQTGWLENENLFVNELFRLGGIRTLRGFNEESLFASFYSIGTVEFRYLLEQNSNIYVFYDHSYYERKMLNEYFHDTPYSFGAGISFQTKAGIFSMNYALGSEQGNAIQFRGAKVHFGFTNYF
jgi:outer membrane protein assembly factor BamA